MTGQAEHATHLQDASRPNERPPLAPAPEPNAAATWERFDRAASLFTVAAVASCWLGPLGIALALAALTTGLLARARRRRAGVTTRANGLVLACAVGALVVSIATTPVIVAASVDNVIKPVADTL